MNEREWRVDVPTGAGVRRRRRVARDEQRYETAREVGERLSGAGAAARRALPRRAPQTLEHAPILAVIGACNYVRTLLILTYYVV